MHAAAMLVLAALIVVFVVLIGIALREAYRRTPPASQPTVAPAAPRVAREDVIDDEVGVVWKRVGWEAAVETDPALFADAVEFALDGLVAACAAADVAPVGTLTVERQDSEALDMVACREYLLRLQLPSVPCPRCGAPVFALGDMEWRHSAGSGCSRRGTFGAGVLGAA